MAKQRRKRSPGERPNSPPSQGGGGGGGPPSNPYTQSLVLTAVPTAILPAEGTQIASVSGRAVGSTLTPQTSNMTVIDLIDTARVNAGSKTGKNTWNEAGRVKWSMSEDNNISVRTAEGELVFLPQGVSLGDPWTPFNNSDFRLYNAFVQESVPTGLVATWPNIGGLAQTTNRGNYDAVNADAGTQPTKLSGTGGVEFANEKVLVWPGDQLRAFAVHTILTIFRLDPTTAGTPGITSIVMPQYDGTGATFSHSGSLMHQKAGGRLWSRWRDPNGDNDIETTGLNTNYSTWCFVLRFIRDGKMGVRFNGNPTVWSPYPNHNPLAKSDPAIDSYFGHSSNNATNASATFAIDAHIEWSDLSDEYIYKIERWAADRAGLTLPVGHKYRTTSPVVDLSDFPLAEFMFNKPEWRRFQEDYETSSRVQAKGSSMLPQSLKDEYTYPVYLEDFRADPVSDGTGVAINHFYSLGGVQANTIGIAATLVHASSTPDMYPWSPGELGIKAYTRDNGGQQQKLTGQMSTVNRYDEGVTFKGGGWWRVKWKFDTSTAVNQNAYFPCVFWLYNHRRAKSPFASNFELDTFEIESGYPASTYMNGFSHHLHPAANAQGHNGRHNGNSDPDPYNGNANLRRKPFAGYMNAANGWPREFDQADGQEHIMDMFVDDDTDIVKVYIDEYFVGQFKKSRFWDYRYHPIFNNAIFSGRPTVTEDYATITWTHMEFRKKPAHIQTSVTPFTAQPTISGLGYVGQKLTLTPNLPSELTQARTEWYYDDGYHITRSNDNTLRLTSDDVGKQIRCKVIPISYWEDPEVWTAAYPAIVGNSAIVNTMDVDFVTNSFTVNGNVYANWAAVVAAYPQISFIREQTGSVFNFATGGITPYVAANTMRIHASHGLLYEADETLAANQNTVRPVGVNGAFVYNQFDGPLGPKSMHGFYEDSTTNTRRIADVNIGTTVAGQRTSVFFIGRGGTFRSYMRLQALFQGNTNTYYNFQTGAVTGPGGGALNAGVTATMTQCPAPWTDHFFCTWSKEDTVGGIANASCQLYIARTTSDTGTYAGDPANIAGRLGIYQVRTNTSRLTIPLPWCGSRARLGDQLMLPLGPTPKDIVLTLTNPEDGTTSTQTLSAVSGDYVIPAASLNQPAIKRIQIS